MKRIYLSGPMTGLPELNFPLFHSETARLRSLGYEVINPAELNPAGGSWGDCMRRDIIELLNCDTIALLKGWDRSEGAFLEITIAKRLGLTVVNAQDLVKREAV